MHCLYHLLSFSMNLTLSSFLPPLNWSVFRRKRKLYIYWVPLALQIFLYGGYSKEVSSDKSSSEKGIVHSDMWSLDPTTWEWNKVHNLNAFLVFRWTYRSVIEWKVKHDFFMATDTITKEPLSLHHLSITNRRWSSKCSNKIFFFLFFLFLVLSLTKSSYI